MTRDDVLAVLAQLTDTRARRDWIAFGELYAETVKVESPFAGSVVGREAVIRAQEAFYTAFPDIVITEDPPIIDGDRIAIVAEVAGTHVGDILGLPPSGRAFRFQIAFILHLQDHLIAHERRLYDFTGLLVQIGVLRAKPA